jgi:hypothetical protein
MFDAGLQILIPATGSESGITTSIISAIFKSSFLPILGLVLLTVVVPLTSFGFSSAAGPTACSRILPIFPAPVLLYYASHEGQRKVKVYANGHRARNERRTCGSATECSLTTPVIAQSPQTPAGSQLGVNASATPVYKSRAFFLLSMFQGYAPDTDLDKIRDRVVTTVIFHYLWPERARLRPASPDTGLPKVTTSSSSVTHLNSLQST